MKRSVVLMTIALAVGALAHAQSPTGDPVRGERLFKELQCASCHRVNQAGGTSAPDLGKRTDTTFAPNALAGAMWSHFAAMGQAMDRASIQRPQMTQQQAADLFAFFAGSPRAEKQGDPRQGQRVYEAKLCSSCHDSPMLGAPDLAKQAGRFSAFSIIASLWQHGEGMLSRMVAKNTEWQKLSAEEMANLIAFLNSRK